MQDPKNNTNSNTILDQWSSYALKHSEPIPQLLLELEKETPSKSPTTKNVK